MKEDILDLLLVTLLTLIILMVGGAIFHLLWNSVMPQVFDLPVLSYVQAIFLWALIRISFGQSSKKRRKEA